MLSAVLLSTGAALNVSPDQLLEVQRRRTSNARAAFGAAVMLPQLKDPLHNPTELFSLIAAEERCADATLMPHHVSTRIQSTLEQIVAPAAQRVALSKSLGNEVKPEDVATSVTTALFGSDAPDDAQNSEPYFQRGLYDPRAFETDYDDPSNYFIDQVLERRQGVPLATSLIASAACAQLDMPMVGLRARDALLLAPADGSPFFIDCFMGGGVISEEAAAALIASRLPAGARMAREETSSEEDAEEAKRRLAIGRRQLAALRSTPMTALQWGADLLRSLRRVHEERSDVVRLVGVLDRLRMIGAQSRLAVSDVEMREYAGQLALCIFQLGWEPRRGEARILLQGCLRSHAEMGTDPDEPRRIEALLAEPWFLAAPVSRG